MINFKLATAKKQHKELCRLINFHDMQYWVLERSLISDQNYDLLVRDLITLETDFPELITAASPTQRRGGALMEHFKEVAHVEPMRSLAKFFTTEELTAKLQAVSAEVGEQTVSWLVEPKIDGLTLDLRYEDGVLMQALTGGDGYKGSDVTENARTIKSIPLQLGLRPGTSYPGVVHIRGEVYMAYKDLETANKRRIAAGEAQLANPRNAAGGAMRLLDPKEAAKRKLSFLAFWAKNMSEPEEVKVGVMKQSSSLGWLKFMGFNVVDAVKCIAIEDVVEQVNKFGFARKSLPYPTDGAVIKLNELWFESQFPGTRDVPGIAWAFKYAPDQVETKLTAITIQVGRSGRLTPVAEMEPVTVAGSVVSRATLHNMDFIKERDIRVGDTVVLQKAGEIIPEIVGVVMTARPKTSVAYEFPLTCPKCGSVPERQKVGDDEEGVAYVCPNLSCDGRLISAIEHWAKAMEMDEVGPVLADTLVTKKLVGRIDDLYKLTPHALIELHIGPGITESFLRELNGSKSAGMECVIKGLGIPRIGATIARKAAIRFADIMEFLLNSIKGDYTIGDANLKSIQNWMADAGNMEMLRQLEKLGVSMKSKTHNPNAADGPFAGKTFVFTGTLVMDRDKAKVIVETNGGKATGSVSKKTSYVVVGEEPGSNKLEGAKKHNVPILTEEQFMAMIADSKN